MQQKRGEVSDLTAHISSISGRLSAMGDPMVLTSSLEALRSGGIVVACGMSRFAGDSCVAPVFERADHLMYENKNRRKHIG